MCQNGKCDVTQFNPFCFQRKSGKGCNPKGPLDGHCTILFDGSEDDKTKNIFKFKKCFATYRQDVKAIDGTFIEDKLEVHITINYRRTLVTCGDGLDKNTAKYEKSSKNGLV